MIWFEHIFYDQMIFNVILSYFFYFLYPMVLLCIDFCFYEVLLSFSFLLITNYFPYSYSRLYFDYFSVIVVILIYTLIIGIILMFRVLLAILAIIILLLKIIFFFTIIHSHRMAQIVFILIFDFSFLLLNFIYCCQLTHSTT